MFWLIKSCHRRSYEKYYIYVYRYGKKVSSIFGDLIYLAIIAGIIYVIYKTCIASPATTDAPPPYDDHQRRDFHNTQPPPPYGFRPEYMPNNGGYRIYP